LAGFFILKEVMHMKASLIKESLLCAIKAGQPVYIWGPPGVGKSDVVNQVATELGRNLVDVRAILLDPVDLRGIPKITEDGRAEWCPPDFLPRDGEGILFLDELNAAAPSVQAACYQLVLDRKLGEYELPDGWAIAAAGNRETDRAVTHRMSSALASRFVHLGFDVDNEDWIKWALDAGVQTEVIAFIKFRPELLHQFDPQKNEKSFPTPRTWEFASKILAAKPLPEIEFDMIKGTVGEGAAAELMAFMQIYRQLPNPDVIIMSPQSVDVSSDPGILYAISIALARKASDQNIGNILEYTGRMPQEFQAFLVKTVTSANPGIASCRPFIEWASQNEKILV
jgi:MoxR-like ATPase